jgi:hypothetical protein
MKNSYVSEDQFLNNQFTGVGGGWVVFMFTHETLRNFLEWLGFRAFTLNNGSSGPFFFSLSGDTLFFVMSVPAILRFQSWRRKDPQFA